LRCLEQSRSVQWLKHFLSTTLLHIDPEDPEDPEDPKEQTYFQLSPTLFLLARQAFDAASNRSGVNSSIIN
jgi:hypothetical protein